MTNHDKPTNTNFWFGFALGSITLTAAAYMLGTKKGREKLKQLLEYADTIDDMPQELFELLPSIKEMLKKGDSSVASEDDKKGSFTDHIGQSLESIMEKVKSSSEDHSETDQSKPSARKYFVKDTT